MTPLSLTAPLRSLRALRHDVSHRAHGAARVPPVSDAAVVKAERSGSRIQVDTLAEYARALGYRLVIGVEPTERGEK